MNSAKPTAKKYKLKKGRLAVLIIAAVIIILGSGALYQALYSTKACDAANTATTTFEIKSGASTKAIASSLEKSGLIRSDRAFIHYVKKSGNDGKLRVGS